MISLSGVILVTVVAVLLPLAAAVIGYLLWGEVRKYRSGQQLVSVRRFRLRVTAGVLSLVLCAVMFVMLFVLPKAFLKMHPPIALGLGIFCLASAVALMFVMVADVQEVEDRLKQREAEFWRDFARFLAARERDAGKDQGESGP